MLIDDNEHDNYFHERAIKEVNDTTVILAKESGVEALDYLKSKKKEENQHPDLIFLDINMPGMNGWDFLEEYNLLDEETQSHAIIVMLSTSDNEADIARAKTWRFISDYVVKPLTKELVEEVVKKYFK